MTSLMTSFLRAAILIAAILAAWQLLFAYAGPGALTAPYDTIVHALQLLSSASFYPHLIETAQAFAIALAIAISCGILIGFTLGLYRFAADVGEPVLVALYSIPKITLYPIVLLAFGIGMPAKIAFGAIHGIMPIAIFALGAVRNLNPVYVKAARVMRMTPSRIATRVLLPAAIPEIFTGVRIGFWLTLPDPARSSACAAAAPIAMHGPITRTLDSAATSPSMLRPAATTLSHSGETRLPIGT